MQFRSLSLNVMLPDNCLELLRSVLGVLWTDWSSGSFEGEVVMTRFVSLLSPGRQSPHSDSSIFPLQKRYDVALNDMHLNK